MPDGQPLGRISLRVKELNARIRGFWKEPEVVTSVPWPENPDKNLPEVEPDADESKRTSWASPPEFGAFIDWGRPYKDLTVDELEDVWIYDQGNPDVEEVLLEELGHRTSVDARILKYRIMERDY